MTEAPLVEALVLDSPGVLARLEMITPRILAGKPGEWTLADARRAFPLPAPAR